MKQMPIKISAWYGIVMGSLWFVFIGFFGIHHVLASRALIADPLMHASLAEFFSISLRFLIGLVIGSLGISFILIRLSVDILRFSKQSPDLTVKTP